MRVSLLLVFALAWISACIGCGTRPNPQAPAHALASQIEAETVALVHLDDEDGKPRSHCAGVFVAPNVILTAEHCVAILGMDPVRRLAHRLGLDDDTPWNPVGQKALYAPQGDLADYLAGVVLADDPADDLGAIRVVLPSTVYAHVSRGLIEDGDPVEYVGHPVGNLWSYAEGYVSATRPNALNARGRPVKTLQIAGPFTFGNSGGGIFDRFGRLVGVASYLDTRMPGMGFCVHRDSVQKFLHGIGVL